MTLNNDERQGYGGHHFLPDRPDWVGLADRNTPQAKGQYCRNKQSPGFRLMAKVVAHTSSDGKQDLRRAVIAEITRGVEKVHPTGWSGPVCGRELRPPKSSAFHGALYH